MRRFELYLLVGLGMALGAMVCALSVTLFGCAPLPLDAAVATANSSKELIEQAGAVIEPLCVAEYDGARDRGAVRAVDAWCTPVRAAWAEYRRAWLVLSAAVVAARAGEVDPVMLRARERDLASAALVLSRALERR